MKTQRNGAHSQLLTKETNFSIPYISILNHQIYVYYLYIFAEKLNLNTFAIMTKKKYEFKFKKKKRSSRIQANKICDYKHIYVYMGEAHGNKIPNH